MTDSPRPAGGAFVAQLDLELPHLLGVAEKIRAQASVLQQLPATIDSYHMAGGKVVVNGSPIPSIGHGTMGRRISRYFLLLLALGRRTKPLDFLYLRYQGISPLLILTLRRLRRRNPGIVIIMEMPTWPHEKQTDSLKEKTFDLLERISHRSLRNHIDRVLTYSREPSIFGIPTIQTDNGVDVEAIPPVAQAAEGSAFRMLGLANLSSWHGYDRAIEGMARYFASGGSRDVQFDVVGTGNELSHLEQLVKRHGLADRVHFHGPLRGPKLNAIVQHATVGLSGLGSHRWSADTTNLKSREFCARGLPFVIDHPDRDFPADLPFVHVVPGGDSPLDIAAAMEFHDRLVVSQPGYRTDMRAFALRHLTWQKKLQPLLAYLEHSLAERLQEQKAH